MDKSPGFSRRSRDYWTAPRLDILSELYRRNMEHAVERVVAQLDPSSLRSARMVSINWRRMVTGTMEGIRRRRRKRRRRGDGGEGAIVAERSMGREEEITAAGVDKEGGRAVIGTQQGHVSLKNKSIPVVVLALLVGAAAAVTNSVVTPIRFSWWTARRWR